MILFMIDCILYLGLFIGICIGIPFLADKFIVETDNESLENYHD